jgi:uridine kinase
VAAADAAVGMHGADGPDRDPGGQVAALGPGRLRVAVDGLTGAGKTSFGHELAAALRGLGRATMRASMDDFKYPWRHAREHGYDRISGEGYYRNAYDFGSARNLLLSPAGPSGPAKWCCAGTIR